MGRSSTLELVLIPSSPLSHSYVLQQLNIHPYASSVTLLSAYDGSVIVNTTNYITDVYQQWNVTTQAQCKFLIRLSVAL